MRERHVVNVDGEEYEIFDLPPRKALSVLTRITKIALEPIGNFVSSMEGDALLDTQIDPQMLGKALAALSQRLDEEPVIKTVDEVFEYVHKKTKKGGFIQVNIDTDFSGRIGHMLKVLYKALEVNYSDFLGESGGLLGAAVSKMKGRSRQTSTGESGESSQSAGLR
jgi:hypothetical protein